MKAGFWIAPEGADTPIAILPIGTDGAAIRKAIPELAHLGFDPVEDMMSWDRFGLLLHQHKAGIKAMLMDQTFTA